MTTQPLDWSIENRMICRYWAGKFSATVPPRFLDRDDLFQEAALAVLKRGRGKPAVYTSTVVKHRLRNVYRHAIRKPTSVRWMRNRRPVAECVLTLAAPVAEEALPSAPVRIWMRDMPTVHQRVAFAWADGQTIKAIAGSIGKSHTYAWKVKQEALAFLRWRAWGAGLLDEVPEAPLPKWGRRFVHVHA